MEGCPLEVEGGHNAGGAGTVAAVTNMGCKFRRPVFLSTGNWTSVTRKWREESGREMWRWQRGVGKWSSVWREERERRRWIM